MNRPSFLAPRVFVAALCFVGSCLASSPTAHAGLGDLVKKAKEKAAQTVTDKAGQKAAQATGTDGDMVEFNDVILELTSDRLDHVILGLKAARAGNPQRAALVAKKNKLIDQQDALATKFGPAMDESARKRNDAEQCWSEILQSHRGEREEALQQRAMNDPAFREKWVLMAQQLGTAQAKGDSTTVRRIHQDMLAMAGPTHADSAEARQKCGPIPAAHPARAQVDALQRDAAALDEQIRDMDRLSIAKQAEASGMNERQFAMALERVEMYLAAKKSKAVPHAFTSSELNALAEHEDALKAALS